MGVGVGLAWPSASALVSAVGAGRRRRGWRRCRRRRRGGRHRDRRWTPTRTGHHRNCRSLHAWAAHVDEPADPPSTRTEKTADSSPESRPPSSASESEFGAEPAIRPEPEPPLSPSSHDLPDGTSTTPVFRTSNAPGIETSTQPMSSSRIAPLLVTVNLTVVGLARLEASSGSADRPEVEQRRGRGRPPSRSRPRRACSPAASRIRDQATRCAGSHSGIREIVSGRGASATCSMPSMNAPTSRSSS